MRESLDGHPSSAQGRSFCGGDFELRSNHGKELPGKETQAEGTLSQCKIPGLKTSFAGSRNNKKANFSQVQEMRRKVVLGELREASREQIS